MAKKKKAEVIFFPNGNVCVFVNGKQFPKAQGSWFLKYIEKLEAEGIDVLKSTYKMPNDKTAVLFKVKGGYNWTFSI